MLGPGNKLAHPSLISRVSGRSIMSKSELLLVGLLITAIAGTAWAQSATGGVAGSAADSGNYGISGSYGGASGGVGASGSGSTSGIGLGGFRGGNGGVGASGGAADSSALGGSYSMQGSGLPAGVSGLPSIGATR